MSEPTEPSEKSKKEIVAEAKQKASDEAQKLCQDIMEKVNRGELSALEGNEMVMRIVKDTLGKDYGDED